MEDLNHEVPGHDENEKKKIDHYHDIHHFDKHGAHDDIKKEDFSIKKSFYTSKRNLIFRITLTSIFLALAIALSALEMLFEEIWTKIPIYGVTIPFRILDIMIVTLSLGSIGVINACFVGAITPIIHLVHAHNPLNILVDSIGYFSSVWIIWLIFYVIFRNSYIHRDPNIKVDKFKRWAPMSIYVPIMTVIYTCLVFACLYISTRPKSNLVINLLTQDNYCGSGEWSTIIKNLNVFIPLIACVEIIRFSICYVMFAIVEVKLKKINHNYK